MALNYAGFLAVVLFVIECLQVSEAFKWGGARVPLGTRLVNGHRQILHMGYVPPEKDPEYRPMVKKSLLKPLEGEDADKALQIKLPVPKEGDIVGAPGKWEGEVQLGKIRFLEYSNSSKSWSADIVPLVEGKSESVWVVDKGSRSFLESIDKIRPVQNFFMRSENGYRISFRGNTTSMENLVYKSTGYRELAPTYQFPTKQVNLDVVKKDMGDYEELKKRIILNSLKFGAVGAVVVQLWLGFDAALSYAVGASSGALYLFLLGKKTDQIGSSFSAVNNPSDDPMEERSRRLNENLGKARFAAPLLFVGLLTAKNVANGGQIQPFELVPRSDFLPALGGFLTYRISLFVTEVATELTDEDLLGFLPGSVAEGMRLNKKLKEQQVAGESAEQEVLTRVVFVTGPRAAGRLSLSARLGGKTDKLGKPVKRVRFLTTDNLAAQRNPERYTLVSMETLEQQRQEGSLAWEGTDKLELGMEVPVALTSSSLEATNEELLLVDGEPKILDALRTMPSLRLSPVWISLQTKEQFIEKASDIIQKEMVRTSSSPAGRAGEAADQVSDLVNEAAKDITYYMQKAPLFEYTLLNLGSDDETFAELEAIVKTC
jgi:hypothetical protein